ncbi:TonB-dependent receptor [Novosphingobium sp. CCH12-A3]|uniref:TonB-dependent receptor n=1 Tax=Novosphingobium sp. CCH12-A3 TaxID=1768752 RepID=UPI000784695D|nr:TonB-dependent receptor [Novosphingobium sp. CCH12-A3]
MRTSINSRFLIGSAAGAIALAMAMPVAAQEAQSSVMNDEPSNAEIIVTGIRGSLQRNMEIKRTASGVVDAISAEDIGKFPDANVADALQRLPGISIQRSGARGEANGVTVRGFGGDFNDTQFDGRRLSTASGSRAVDFTTIGSDFVSNISVYKTPDVELGASAIGATINVALPKPFDSADSKFAVKASGAVQDRSGKVTPSGAALASTRFADDTMGILAYAAYRRVDTEANQVFIPGWIGNYFYQCQAQAACQTNDFTPAKKNVLGWFPQQVGANQITTKDERIDGRLAYQWQAGDDVLLTLDGNFTRQTLNTATYGYGAWFNGDDLRNVKQDSNGTVVDFNQFGTPMDFNASLARTINQTYMFGGNLKWDATDELSFDFDASLSRSVLNPGRNGYQNAMDIGYGGTNVDPNGSFLSTGCTYPAGAGPTTAPTSCTNYSTILGANTGVTIGGPSNNYLPSIHDVGPGGDVSRFTDKSLIGSHVIAGFPNYFTNLVKQVKIGGKWDGDNLKVHFGGSYQENKYHQEGESPFVNGTFFRYGGYGAPSGRTGAVAPLPDSVYQGIISTNNFIPGYQGNLAPAIIKYDPVAVYRVLEATGRGTTAPAFNPDSVLNVKEQTFAAYLRINFESEIGDMPFKVSAGVRDEYTKLTSGAIGRNPVNLITVPTDPTLIQVGSYTPQQLIERSISYNYVLPSLDVKLEVKPNLILRFDASRTLTRPALGDLRPTINLGTLRKGSLAASGGNAGLKPYLADNLDLGVEWYYGSNSYFAVNGFMKFISNFIVGGVSTQTINGVVDPFTNQPAQFQVNSKVNGPDGVVRGVEIAWQQVFGDSGFGFNANATLVNTNRTFNTADISGSAFAITGLANSANLVAFYDKNGLEVRVAGNWRDKYLLGLGQQQGGTFGAEPVNVNRQFQIDASASYQVTKELSVFVEGTNLNNSNYSTYGRFSNMSLDTFNYGRRFVFGARFNY